jgi:hypothetical protein
LIQGILTFQFVLNPEDIQVIFPHFHPIELLFQDKNYDENYFSDLISDKDIYAILYQHTTGVFKEMGEQSSFYIGYLNDSPYQVISFFIQVETGSQYIAFSLFDNDDDIGLYEKLIRDMASNLERLFIAFEKAKSTQQLSLLTNIRTRITEVLKFAFFQIDRLANLDKLQKAALIFSSDERLKTLEILREGPISKRGLKRELSFIKENPNVDTTIDPFVDLNIVRREWIKGKRDKDTGRIKHQGEYFFLIKDIVLARVPNLNLLEQLKKIKPELVSKFELKLMNYFKVYDPKKQDREEIRKTASILLDPDIYDNFVLMRNKFYPLDKIPKIFSEFADTEQIINQLKELYVLTEIKDEKKRSWILLLADIKPLVFFPEYILPKIREAYKTSDAKRKITFEIAKKAHDLLEVSFPEEIEF